jgi:hypothetical protein
MRAARPLRAMTADEEQALQRATKATSERVDVVRRARALHAVSAGNSYTQAAQVAGYRSGDSVSQLVERFNQRGLAAVHIACGRGRKASYILAQRGASSRNCSAYPTARRTPPPHGHSRRWSGRCAEPTCRTQ